MDENAAMASTSDRLVYMAHQIARNLSSAGDAQTVEAVADHLESFWDPRMKAQILAIARDHPDRLSPVVAAAIARMAELARPAR